MWLAIGAVACAVILGWLIYQLRNAIEIDDFGNPIKKK